jgi:hypothetical protein
MTLEQPSAARRSRPAKRNRWPRVALAVACGLALLALGVAFGMALRDDPEPGGVQTIVRTLEPLPQTAATTP